MSLNSVAIPLGNVINIEHLIYMDSVIGMATSVDSDGPRVGRSKNYNSTHTEF